MVSSIIGIVGKDEQRCTWCPEFGHLSTEALTSQDNISIYKITYDVSYLLDHLHMLLAVHLLSLHEY